MVKQLVDLETSNIQKAVNLIGITISDAELNELKSGNTISLGSRGLSEIGSVFILAEALLRANLVRVKNITFCDLQKAMEEFSQHSGIPIYCWNSKTGNKCCLLLALVNGKPVIRVSHSSQQPSHMITVPSVLQPSDKVLLETHKNV
ncbi:hypothetical protein NUACC21_56630 [Scytonema sp. NUACC21]